jgi:diacylglycerol kinase family enzyme
MSATPTDPAKPQRAKVIYNPASGPATEGPERLQAIVADLQALNLLPEVYLVNREHELGPVVKDDLRRGHRLFVVCGGDGTIDTVAAALTGTRSVMAMIPGGTQNNVALSLGIPADIHGAVALLRTGRRIKIDVGLALCGDVERPFLEACSIGLLSALFPAGDDIQHGNLARLGDFLSTLFSFPGAEMRLSLDRRAPFHIHGHVVLAANMRFTGPHYPVAPLSSLEDGLLDLVVFADLSKLDLLGTALQVVRGGPEDVRIRRFQARRVVIETNPPMPIAVDGFALGEGSLRLSVRRRALNVIAGPLVEQPGPAAGEPSPPNVPSLPIA